MSNTPQYDVIIIGAGPSGSSAAALLVQKGFSVLILEKLHFPRFCIGESLLSHCMSFFKEAGFLPILEAKADELAFQTKVGAFFMKQGMTCCFDFRDKYTAGPDVTWQVKRDVFDQLLVDEAAKMGAEIRYGESIVSVDLSAENPYVKVVKENGETYGLSARFLLDASGHGRVLPRLFNLEIPSNLPFRRAIFAHIEDHITDPHYDRNKITIVVHELDDKAWFWLIPFSDGTSSIGIVSELSFFEKFADEKVQHHELDCLFKRILAADKKFAQLLTNAQFKQPFREIKGYSANVKQLYGKKFAILGNAGEFLDPVFSSGITIALKSSSMAAPLVERELNGQNINWLEEYEKPLRRGIDIFRVYVDGWYNGTFQDVVFSPYQKKNIKSMICSLLAGYAWDSTNPMYEEANRKLETLAEICREIKHG